MRFVWWKPWLITLLLLAGCQSSAMESEKEWSLPALCYHRFGTEKAGDDYSISAARFEEQLAWLKQAGYKSVSLDQIARKLKGLPLAAWPEKPILLTLDDGYANSWTIGGPILKKYGFSAVYFITTDMIGTGSAWLSSEQLVEIRSQGFEVGSHSRSHVNLAKPKKGESPQDYHSRTMDELQASREKLEKILGEKVLAIAYPYGAYNRKIEKWVKDAGYALAFSVSKGHSTQASETLRLRRNLLMGHPSIETFKRLVEKLPLGNAEEIEGEVWIQGEIPTMLRLNSAAKLRLDDQDIMLNQGNLDLPQDLKPGFHLLKFYSREGHPAAESHSLFQIVRPSWQSHFGIKSEAGH